MTALSWVFIFFIFFILAVSFTVGIIYYRKNKRLNEKMNNVRQRIKRNKKRLLLKMSHHDFLVLTEEEKYQVVLTKGVKIAELSQDLYKFILYQVNGFYIEWKIDIETDEVKSITSFTSTAPIEKYTKQININELL